MSIKLVQGSVEANQRATDGVDDLLVEKVWRDLDEQLPLERVGQVVAEIAHGYQNAKIKTFLPILIRREAVEQLRGVLKARSLANGRFPDKS